MRVTLCMTAAFGATATPLFSPGLRQEGLKLKGEVINDVNFILQNGRITENVLAAIAHLGHIAVSIRAPLSSEASRTVLYLIVDIGAPEFRGFLRRSGYPHAGTANASYSQRRDQVYQDLSGWPIYKLVSANFS